MKIAYLGPAGTYCEKAAKIFAKAERNCILEQYSTIYDTLNSVINNKCDCAVVPIENSIEGSVNATLDILSENAELKINREILLPVRHSLMAKEKTKKDEIELILSHPQAIAQCNKYLKNNFPDTELRATTSTSEGARQATDLDTNWAAIGDIEAAKVHGLKVIEEDIQDSANNVTRFVAVSLLDTEGTTGNDKTSIVFSSEDRPGSLYRILEIFNLWDINLTRIESRPARNELGRYIFFVDFEGHQNDPDVKDALTMVSRKTSFFRLMGSYSRMN